MKNIAEALDHLEAIDNLTPANKTYIDIKLWFIRWDVKSLSEFANLKDGPAGKALKIIVKRYQERINALQDKIK